MMRIAIGQINTTVGDLTGNAEKILSYAQRADELGADLVVFPEMALSGYPPEDLILRDDFLAASDAALSRIADRYEGQATLLIGAPQRTADGLAVQNTLTVVTAGRVGPVAAKQHLPNYGVFDERRVFAAGDHSAYVELDGVRVGLTICEDLWVPGGPVHELAAAGATVIVNASASPFHAGKLHVRRDLLATRAREHGVAIAYCNMVAGQDELIFDGGSMGYDHRGRLLCAADQFAEQLLLMDVDTDAIVAHRRADMRIHGLVAQRPVTRIAQLNRLSRASATIDEAIAEPLNRDEELYRALVLALRDYHDKNGFRGAILGLSGGVDSALVAAIAADALGADRVTCVTMPSQFSSDATQNDARDMAARLGCTFKEIAIAPMMAAYGQALDGQLAPASENDVTFENIQARIRGNLLMAISNREGLLVISTGNKSEAAVGYATLYGDMAGGFALIKDLPKLDVFALCRWRNAQEDVPVIPPSIIERPPSAELSADQKDTDSLPPYEVLDPILEGFVEQDRAEADLIADGFDAATVRRVCALVDRAEYKRRQAAPGPKVTSKAFGRERRVPITSRFAAQRKLTADKVLS